MRIREINRIITWKKNEALIENKLNLENDNSNWSSLSILQLSNNQHNKTISWLALFLSSILWINNSPISLKVVFPELSLSKYLKTNLSILILTNCSYPIILLDPSQISSTYFSSSLLFFPIKLNIFLQLFFQIYNN